MTRPTALVLRTAGTNCDAETVHALGRAGAAPELLHLHRLMEQPERLEGQGLLVFPGGFTYGDDIASGAVFSAEMRDRVLPAVRRFVADGGLVLGICNGFQILVRSGLLPGNEGTRASLAPNESGRFECRWVRLEARTDHCAFLEPGQVIHCPVAHMEGRFVTRDTATLDGLRESGQVALVYTSRDGGTPRYPENPNGSPGAVAGVCDPTGRILGLMPHPERNVESWHAPRRIPTDESTGGLAVFAAGVRAARAAR